MERDCYRALRWRRLFGAFEYLLSRRWLGVGGFVSALVRGLRYLIPFTPESSVHPKVEPPAEDSIRSPEFLQTSVEKTITPQEGTAAISSVGTVTISASL